MEVGFYTCQQKWEAENNLISKFFMHISEDLFHLHTVFGCKNGYNCKEGDQRTWNERDNVLHKCQDCS